MVSTNVDYSMSTSIEWSDQAVHLKDFTTKYPLPNLVRITKGQYRNIGVAKSVYSELYLHAIEPSEKVLAESVRVKESKGIIDNDQRFAIPISYQGWFELLSEGGKAIKPFQTVSDLARVQPPSFLVRENVKCFIDREGEIAMDKMRVVQSGELMSLAGEIIVQMNTPKGLVKRRLLKCTDSKDENAYFHVDQKGLFSPVAGTQNISGVHRLNGLLEKFRFPILVRLVHGIIPSKLEKTFTGVFRLINAYSDETAFVSPLKKDAKMVPISTREPLRLIAAKNIEALQATDEYKYHNEKCSNMIKNFMNSIHILFTLPDPQAIAQAHEQLKLNSNENGTATRNNNLPPGEEDILFEEIEDIYAYVRDGGVVPPPRPRPASIAVQTKAPSSVQGPAVVVTQALPSRSPSKSKFSLPFKKKADKTVITDKIDNRKMPSSPAHRETDLNYWEEPIYDDLEKLRKKLKSQEKMTKNFEVFNQLKNPESFNDNVVKPSHKPSSTPLSSKKSSRSPQTKAADTPVQNLRQVYRRSTTSKPQHQPITDTVFRQRPHSFQSRSLYDFEKANAKEMKSVVKELVSKQHNGRIDFEEEDDGAAPPVPPKNFNEEEVKPDVTKHTSSMSSLETSLTPPSIGDKLGKSPPTPIIPTETNATNIAVKEPTITVHTPGSSGSQDSLDRSPMTSAYGTETTIATHPSVERNQTQIPDSSWNPPVSQTTPYSVPPSSQVPISHVKYANAGSYDVYSGYTSSSPIYQKSYKRTDFDKNDPKIVLNTPNQDMNQTHDREVLNNKNMVNIVPTVNMATPVVNTTYAYPRGLLQNGNENINNRIDNVNNRVSVISSNPVLNNKPQFVAVARVGDSQQNIAQSPVVDANYHRVIHRNNSDHNRRKMQSMYL